MGDMSMPRRGGRAMRGSAVVLTAALLTVTACTSPAPTAVAPQNTQNTQNTGPGTTSGPAAGRDPGPIVPTNSTLRWHSCSGLIAQMGIRDCTMLNVPLNYSQPSGRHISLALDMIPATAPVSQQQGILLVNPGGPGGSGLSLPAELAEGLSPGVARDYDIIGFDPRGVGSSVPELSCDRSFFSAGPRPNYIPASPTAEQVNINRAKTYASDCEQKFGWLLPYMTTENVARDLDSIRAAFGVATINYFAFSYGTYLGQVYATMFPRRVRRMVLDSTVDPTGVWYTDNVDQDYAFQGRMNAFYAWVAQYASTYNLGSTAAQVRSAWYRARNQLLAHPANGVVGADELDDTYIEGGYDDQLWPGLAQALSDYLNQGDSAGLIGQYQSYGVQNENEFAVYNAVECADTRWPSNFSSWTSDTEQVYKTAPFYAWGNAWYNAACAFWPVHGSSEPLQITGTGLPGILMLQGTLDPATPYTGAQDAHKLLPSARMVVVTGGGNHGQSFSQPPNNCVQGYLNGYLATGALPQSAGLVNATCPALANPTPGS